MMHNDRAFQPSAPPWELASILKADAEIDAPLTRKLGSIRDLLDARRIHDIDGENPGEHKLLVAEDESRRDADAITSHPIERRHLRAARDSRRIDELGVGKDTHGAHVNHRRKRRAMPQDKRLRKDEAATRHSQRKFL